MANIFGIRIPSIKQQRCQLPLKGKGALLWDENNKEYIDAIARGGLILWAFEYIYRRCHLQATDNIRTCFVWWFYTRA
jgi:hypothetical protein